MLMASAAYVYVADSLPDVATLKTIQLEAPMRVYSRDGRLMAEFGEKRRIPVVYGQIPEQVVQAFVAAEDDRYFQHIGVDYQGLLRAAFKVAMTGEKTQGGSTITMQVARNYLLTREKTYIRKIREIFIALNMERVLSKAEILELYLNKIFLGHRAYGVASAAEVYYGRTLAQLSLDQAATLAGLPKAPSSDNPVTSPSRAKSRRDYVLRRMAELGFINEQDYISAREVPVLASLHGPTVAQPAPYLAEMVRAEMLDRFGTAAYDAGYKVTTTADSRLQGLAVNAVRNAVLAYDRRHGFRGVLDHRCEWQREAAPDAEIAATLNQYPRVARMELALVREVNEDSAQLEVRALGPVELTLEGVKWGKPYIDEARVGDEPTAVSDVVSVCDVLYVARTAEGTWELAQPPVAQSALVAMDPDDGAVVALVGGYDFNNNKFNRAVQARRQPGSSFKPFVYSAALDNGFTAATLVPDSPVVFDDPLLEDTWRPENYSGRFAGPMRLREALVKSRNLVSIRVLREMGLNSALRHFEHFGFDTTRLPRDLSLALGSAAMAPMEMAAAYSVLASGGFRTEPYFIQRVETADGELLFEADPLVVCAECTVIHERAADAPQASIVQASARMAPEMPVSDEFACYGEPQYMYKYSQDHLASRTVSPQNIYLISDMMRDVIRRGTGVRANELGRTDLSGKTGTTNDQRDAWFSGFNADLVATVWVGFDDLSELGPAEVGGVAALPAWKEFMGTALEGVPNHIVPQPYDLVRVKISSESGLLASRHTPQWMYEVFRTRNVPDIEPVEQSLIPYEDFEGEQQPVEAEDEEEEEPLF